MKDSPSTAFSTSSPSKTKDTIKEIESELSSIVSAIETTVAQSKEREQLLSSLKNNAETLTYKVIDIKEISSRQRRRFRRKSAVLLLKIIALVLSLGLVVSLLLWKIRGITDTSDPSQEK